VSTSGTHQRHGHCDQTAGISWDDIQQESRSGRFLSVNEFASLSDEQKSKIRRLVATEAERSYRRGFQQGYDARKRGDQICDLYAWRRMTPKRIAISPFGDKPTTSEYRVDIESEPGGLFHHIGLGQRDDSTVSEIDIRKWVAPLFPALWKEYRQPRLSARVRFFVLNRDGFRCKYCGASADDARLHVDHVVPRVAGGDDDPSNLVAACDRCNLGKGTTRID